MPIQGFDADINLRDPRIQLPDLFLLFFADPGLLRGLLLLQLLEERAAVLQHAPGN